MNEWITEKANYRDKDQNSGCLFFYNAETLTLILIHILFLSNP